ncbi:MAG: IS110 family transposase [Gammaproteobacteria bacterium]|nr:IS110 family transposase [Gammaproteobacteria bacterium]
MTKKVTRSTTPEIYIGLDVHKSSISIAYAAADGSDPVFYGKTAGSNLSAERALAKLRKKLGVEKEDLRICYEAGPTGFILVRRLIQLNYDCIVIAPSKIPQKPGDKVKTDKKDARKLARLLRAGELEPIHIPSVDDEAIRDLCRARTDAVQARSRAKKQLLGFMLRNGMAYTGKTNWTQAHLNYIRKVAMPDPVQQIVLEEYIMEIDALEERVARLLEHMKEQLETWNREPMVRALMSLRGFQIVTAMTLIAELGDLDRFASPRQLMGYLGLVPGEESSGTKRRQGAITKTGNSHARWMLVESANAYENKEMVSPALSKRQEGQLREVKVLSWRAQTRLCYRRRKLSARKLARNKVTIAIARELCGFIWELDSILRSKNLVTKQTT